MATRTADARWDGDLENGSGTMRFGGGAFEGAYTAKSRFEEGEGTNPEELIAAAHAGCFSMALALDLQRAGHDPQAIETTAAVHLRMGDDGPRIHRIALTSNARVAGVSEDEFQQIAEGTRTGCPVSKALAAVDEITLEATLES
jgi:lipoyl-dependent peroxiredoxin